MPNLFNRIADIGTLDRMFGTFYMLCGMRASTRIDF